MKPTFDTIHRFWQAVLAQERQVLAEFFHETAQIDWPNTNERFTVPEYLTANCEYPDQWGGRVLRIETLADNRYLSLTQVENLSQNFSFTTLSFITFQADKIIYLEEFWSENGAAPQWRQEKKLGQPINRKNDSC